MMENRGIAYLVIYLLWILLLGESVFVPPEASADQYIYVTTEKYVYPYPLSNPIKVLGYLRGIKPGTPVDISISLELPGGNVTYLDPRIEFHPNATLVLEKFPFVDIPISDLFTLDGTKVFKRSPAGGNDTAIGDLPAGRYSLSAKITGPGFKDTSMTYFWLVSEEILPNIANASRPIIEEVAPPFGKPGEIISVKGRNLRGDPALVNPQLIDLMNVRITVGGEEQPVTYLASNGTILKFRLLSTAITGDLVEHLILPYWAENQSIIDHSRIPKVVEVTSNAFPFFIAPTISSISPLDFRSGDSIDITGKNFAPEKNLNSVLFSGIAGTILDATNTTLTVGVPPLDIGGATAIEVKVISYGVESEGYLIGYSRPQIYGFFPRKIVPGENIVVSGAGFGDSNRSISVSLGQIPLTIIDVTDTRLTVKTPRTLVHGLYDLIVDIAGIKVVARQKVEIVPSW